MTGRPAVTLKLATSLDGRIATASGESRWITGAAARARVHALRATHDAVLVGAETALRDDPELTARTDPAPPRQPLRAVLDSRLRLDPRARLLQTRAQGEVWVFCSHDASAEAESTLAAAGARIVRLPSAGAGLDLVEACARLHAAGVGRLLVEGGGRVAAAMIAADLVDRLEWVRAPMVLGAEGRPAIGPLGLTALSAAPAFVRGAVEAVGQDLWETYHRKESSACSQD